MPEPSALATIAPGRVPRRHVLTDTQIKSRIQLNRDLRFGLEGATAAQLNVIFVLAQRWRLDPVTDLTLYQGRPWITLEGHLRLMREHPEYRGFESRPLGKAEKEEWGYAVDDIVVETTIHTARWGDIKARGRALRQEIEESREQARQNKRRSAPVGIYDVEIAEKRSIARAHRAAFGQDAPDEEEIEREIADELARRADPARIEANATEHDRVFGTEEPTRTELWAEYARLKEHADELGVLVPIVEQHASDALIAQVNRTVQIAIRQAEAELFSQKADAEI